MHTQAALNLNPDLNQERARMPICFTVKEWTFFKISFGANNDNRNKAFCTDHGLLSKVKRSWADMF
ncbi:uncharacterized protein FTOL_13726 [Fusarium torulosum]|uniref:Uncharacterized protein n=1 Tax=Fusarium torulosum TaxID=33205 RepID=A0AAE8SQ49_9HYPO|nr:uncharacterized protein FTOL_13726 [Fusarium torulosum]